MNDTQVTKHGVNATEGRKRAEATFTAYLGIAQSDCTQTINDLLVDIMFYCQVERYDFDDLLKVAREQYATERKGDK